MSKPEQQALATIRNYDDFCRALLKAGFSLGGGNAKGIFALIPYSWENQAQVDSPVKWHSGDADTDPWEWRMRVLEERDDVAYAKVFFGTSGYITKQWAPYFAAVRRAGQSLAEAYAQGTVSRMGKRIYDVLFGRGPLPLHEVKQAAGITREEAGAFDRALTELQMRMFVTLCGRRQKTNRQGESYGWNSTVLCTLEDFWQARGLPAQELFGVSSAQQAAQAIIHQVLALNPQAKAKDIRKFIEG